MCVCIIWIICNYEKKNLKYTKKIFAKNVCLLAFKNKKKPTTTLTTVILLLAHYYNVCVMPWLSFIIIEMKKNEISFLNLNSSFSMYNRQCLVISLMMMMT